MTEDFPLCTIDGETFECCPHCLNADPSEEIPLQNVYDNSGFEEAPHWDVVAMRCHNCGTQYQI